MSLNFKVFTTCISALLPFGLLAAPLSSASASPSSTDTSININMTRNSISVKAFTQAYDGAAAWTIHDMNTDSATVRLVSGGAGYARSKVVVQFGKDSLFLDMDRGVDAFYTREGAVVPIAELGLNRKQMAHVLKKKKVPRNVRNVSFRWGDKSTRFLIADQGYRNFNDARGDMINGIVTLVAFGVKDTMKEMRNMSAAVVTNSDGVKEWQLTGLYGSKKEPLTLSFTVDEVGHLSRLSQVRSTPNGKHSIVYDFWDYRSTNPLGDNFAPSVDLSVVGPDAWRIVLGGRMELAAKLVIKWVTQNGVTRERLLMAMEVYKDRGWTFSPNLQGGSYRVSDPEAGKVSRGIKIVKKNGRTQLVLVRR